MTKKVVLITPSVREEFAGELDKFKIQQLLKFMEKNNVETVKLYLCEKR